MACQDGHLSVHQLTFATVHGLYLDCYAFRVASHCHPAEQKSTQRIYTPLTSMQIHCLECTCCITLRRVDSAHTIIPIYQYDHTIHSVIHCEAMNARSETSKSYRCESQSDQAERSIMHCAIFAQEGCDWSGRPKTWRQVAMHPSSAGRPLLRIAVYAASPGRPAEGKDPCLWPAR